MGKTGIATIKRILCKLTAAALIFSSLFVAPVIAASDGVGGDVPAYASTQTGVRGNAPPNGGGLVYATEQTGVSGGDGALEYASTQTDVRGNATPNSVGDDVPTYASAQTGAGSNDAPDVSLYFDEKATVRADGAVGKIKNYGGNDSDHFRSVIQASGGGYVAVGYSWSSSGTGSDLPGNKGEIDMVIAKFDANGNKVWVKNYGGSDQDYFESVTQAPGGGYVAVGYSYSSSGTGSDLPGKKGYNDMVIAKFDENGNKVWMKNYGGSGNDFFMSVTQAPGGGYVAVGGSSSPSGTGSDLPGNKGWIDMIIAKFDANGNKVWMKNYGGSDWDAFNSVTQAPSGGYVAVGESESPSGTGSDLPGYKGSSDMVIAKFDANGNKIWIKNYGGSGEDYFESMTQAPGGGYVVVGYSESSSGTGSDLPGNKGGYDMVIAKFDANGYKVWMKNYGGISGDIFYSMTQVSGGGYVAVGRSFSSSGTGSDLPGNKGDRDMVIAKFDANGNKVWMKNYGGSDWDIFYSVAQAPGGGYVAVGESESSSGTGSDLLGNKGWEDMVMAKVDDTGALQSFPWMNNQNAPSAPLLASKTSNAVTLKTVVGVEYSRDKSLWQGSPAFTGLAPDTSYTFYQRYKAKTGYNASPASQGLLVRTDKASPAGTKPGGNTPNSAAKTPKPGTKFKVTFSPNWGKLKIARSYKSKWTSKFSPKPGVLSAVYGKTYGKIPGIKKQPKGYGFAGWWTSASGGLQITSKSKVAISRDTTLYAHWKAKKYKVKFKAGSKTVSRKYAFGEKYSKLPKCKDKSGKFKFLGWYTKASGGKKVTVKSTVKITKTTTFYAHWKRR